jgi:hypothetical protein
MACYPEDEDFQEIQAKHQAIIDQIGYTWQISEFRVTDHEGKEAVFKDVGYISFAHCELTRHDIGGCDGGSTYQWQQSPEVVFEYTVLPYTDQLQVFVHEQSHSMEGIENLLDNWYINKLNEDSLILSHDGYRARTIRLFKE